MAYIDLGNISSLQCPFNPAENFVNLTGLLDHTHSTSIALVYQQSHIPTPPRWIVLTWLQPLILVLASLYSSIEWKPLNLDDQGYFKFFAAVLREPGIAYNIFKIVLAIAKSPSVRKNGTIPSSSSLGTAVFSLLVNSSDRDTRLDRWSVPAVLASFGGQCVILHQLILDLTNGAAYGYASTFIVGGTCPRLLEKRERCGSLNSSGCARGVRGSLSAGLRTTDTRVGNYERIAGLLSVAYLGLMLLVWISYNLLCLLVKKGIIVHKNILPYTSHDEVHIELLEGTTEESALDALTYATDRKRHEMAKQFLAVKCGGLFYFALLGFMMLFLLSSQKQFVDSIGDGPLSSNSTIMNGTIWSECFRFREPSSSAGFLGLWVEQEWNGSWERITSLFALL